MRPRPAEREFAGSYLVRLAAANCTTPALLAQAICGFAPMAEGVALRLRGVTLSDLALDRWTIMAGTTPPLLTRALADLDVVDDQKQVVFTLHARSKSPTKTALQPYSDTCPRCRARHAGAEIAPAPPTSLRLSCDRHKIWTAAGEAHLHLRLCDHADLHRAHQRLSVLRRRRDPKQLLTTWEWARYYLIEWGNRASFPALTRRWSERIHQAKFSPTGGWPLFAMLPELVSLSDLFSNPAWTTSATARPDGHHRAGYAQLWKKLHPDDPTCSGMTTIHQFGTLPRHLTELDDQHGISDAGPDAHAPSTRRLATWDFDGRVTPVRRR
jgi:hypothetical protein